MPTGIFNFTNVSQESITSMTNSTNPAELLIRINEVVFNGYGFFLGFLAFFVVLFLSAQSFRKEPLSNLLYSSTIVSVVAILSRGVQAYIEGNYYSMLTDYLMWIFPLMSSIFAGALYISKK